MAATVEMVVLSILELLKISKAFKNFRFGSIFLLRMAKMVKVNFAMAEMAKISLLPFLLGPLSQTKMAISWLILIKMAT